MKLPSACYKRLVVFAPTPCSLREEILHTHLYIPIVCVCVCVPVCVIYCRTWVGSGRCLHAGHRLQQRVAGAGHHVLTLFMTALTPRISRPLSSLTPCNHYSTTHRRCGATPEQFLVSLPRETGSYRTQCTRGTGERPSSCLVKLSARGRVSCRFVHFRCYTSGFTLRIPGLPLTIRP